MKLTIEELKKWVKENSENGKRADAIRELIAIRELKGDQVPGERHRVCQVLIDDAWVDVSYGAMENQKKHGVETRILFTAAQKPVGLRQIGSIDHDGGEFAEYFVEFTDSAQVGQAVYVIDSAIEAAGGIVKDEE